MSGSALSRGHQIRLLISGQDYFPALIQALDASRHEVRMETYIFLFDHSGEPVAEALCRAARRGVRVMLAMDGVGTPPLPAPWVQKFAQAGVLWQRFSPLGSLGLLIPSRWRRLHRKLCVVDGRVAFCGGINVVDDHSGAQHPEQTLARLDYAVRVTGPLVAQVHGTMRQFWRRMQIAQGIEQLDLRQLRQGLEEARQEAMRKTAEQEAPARGMLAALVLRDNLRNRSRIEQAYRQAIARARHEVFIANAYFLPGGKLRRALAMAVRRGVRVRVLLQGRYEYFMQYHASKPAYAQLIAAGVEIYEYQAGFLHAKVAVVDGQWATVGSSNLDPLSLLLAREANVVVDDAGFAQQLLEHLNEMVLQRAQPVDQQSLRNRPWQQRVKDRLAYGLMRTTLFLTGRRY